MTIKEKVLHIISQEMSIPVDLIKYGGKEAVKARNMAFYVMVVDLKIGPTDVGRFFQKNHGIVITATKNFKYQLEKDDCLFLQYVSIIEIVQEQFKDLGIADVDAELFRAYRNLKLENRRLKSELNKTKEELTIFKAAYNPKTIAA